MLVQVFLKKSLRWTLGPLSDGMVQGDFVSRHSAGQKQSAGISEQILLNSEFKIEEQNQNKLTNNLEFQKFGKVENSEKSRRRPLLLWDSLFKFKLFREDDAS